MFVESNKVVRDEAKAKVLKLSSKHYGSAEANPFPSNNVSSSIRPHRHLTCHKRFEYDFAETNRIIDTEAFVAAIFRKKKALILRTDPVLKSKSQRNADYIQKRLSEMEYVSGVQFYELLDTITESLVNYNNVFLLKHRNEFASEGLYRDGKAPLASLFVLSPLRLEPIVDENGDTIGYAYYNKGRSKPPIHLSTDDVYHIYTDKKIDVSVGTPPLEAVKDDIQSLRQLEESIENLVYKHASPLMHVKVGTDAQPAGRLPDGTTEIDYYNDIVQNMENEGGLTTGHRVNVSLIGAESHALRAESNMLYFKNRVVCGLKASLLDLGEADSISTAGANAVSKVLKQDVEAYQKLLERFFKRLFNELLLESRWYSNKVRIPVDDEVEFKLLQADLEETIKLESHLANLVNNGLLSPEAFSKETGRELPPPPSIETSVGAPQQAPGTGGTFSNITQPANQHSTHTVLDELRIDKVYTLIEDCIDLPEDLHADLALNINSYIQRAKSMGVESSIIHSVVLDMIKKTTIEFVTGGIGGLDNPNGI